MPSLGVAAALKAGGFGPEQVTADGKVLRIAIAAFPSSRTAFRICTHPERATISGRC